MLAQSIVEFADYLNEAGYAITPEKTTKCIVALSDEDLDLMDFDDVTGTMRFYFCKNRIQREDLPQHFMDFLKSRERLARSKESKKKIKEAEESQKKEKKQYENSCRKLNQKIEDLEQKAEELKQQVIEEWKPDPTKFTKAELAFLNKKKKWIDSLKMPDVEQILSGKGVSVQSSEKAQKEILKMAKEALKSGKLEKMNDLNKLFCILKKVKLSKKTEAPKLEKAIQAAQKTTMDKIRELKEQKKKEQREHDRVQQELSRKISQMNTSSLIVKPRSIQHRDEFTQGKNSVQLKGGEECPPEAEKEFKYLSEKDKTVIYQYIKENIIKFKTRMTRNIYDNNQGRIDMGATIKNACRTGGLPMHIFKELKRPGKSNLILILDISGSCKEASEMMITFMYLLKEVFPRGCKTYAFIDTLYDITDVMSGKDIKSAIKTTIDMIPRRYSNYERPIREMWENNRQVITKDSFVIMIGDARNNSNRPAEDEFKNIVRRARKAYWLNTDELSKWGEGDSIAPVYAKYCPMYETRTPQAIVQFLDQKLR